MSKSESALAFEMAQALEISKQKKRIRELEYENAKLRELIEDIEEVADPMTFDFISARMRHMGIEVKS